MRALLFILAGVVVMLMMSCGLCSSELVRQAKSPDGIVEATWYTRNCGATTDFSTIVSVHQPEASYTDDSDIVLVVKGKPNLKMAWTGPRQLSIECENCGRKDVFRETTRLGNIDVEFSTP